MKCLHATEEDRIEIDLATQRLTYRSKKYRISSSRYGTGTQEGSNRTPLGLFQVADKIGAGDALYTQYKGRKPLAPWNMDRVSKEDIILSRILRLSGLERKNVNTYSRYIYIHGTNDEEGIGDPRSIGCIRMHNREIMELFCEVPLGTVVKIY